jgi:hypothetical protein
MDINFRKLKANEIDIRVGRVIYKENFKGCSLLLYKDARVDMAILDETVGAMNWQRRHTRDNANCAIGIFDDDKHEWVWKEDTGTESNTEAEKGLASDSFKRAGVNWGIGRELYSAKNIIVQCEFEDKKVKNGTSWFVKEIGYTENEITKLVICETTYGKNEKVVYSYEVKTSDKKADKKPFEEIPKQEEILTLEKALEMEIKTKDGIKKLNDLTDEQLTIGKDNWTIKEWVKGAELILLYRAGQKK